MSELPEDQQPTLKRPNDVKDEPTCSKPKKCRRGKKKKFKKRIDEQNPDEGVDSDGFKIPMPPAGPDTKPSVSHPNRKRNRKVLIRPVDVPKAPENSTQFIIDDHDECHLYFNFEKPNPFNSSSSESVKSGNYEDDAAFQDIDYQYESLQDLDNSAYYIQDFETNYFNMRYEEMLGMPRQEIMDTIENMETKILELEEKLYEQDPNLALERLQQKLLQLQEEHSLLSEHNAVLRKALENKETCVETDDSSVSLVEGDDVDANHHSCEECDSSGSSQHSDNDEDYVAEEVYSQEDANYLPEYDAELHITHEHIPDVSDEDDDYSMADDVQCVDDIHMLQNNYRAHHISDQLLSCYASHDDSEGLGEKESHCTSKMDRAEIEEDSGDGAKAIEMCDGLATETVRMANDVCEKNDSNDQNRVQFSVPEARANSDDPVKGEGDEIVTSSGDALEEMSVDTLTEDVSKSCTNELENVSLEKGDECCVENVQNVCGDLQCSS